MGGSAIPCSRWARCAAGAALLVTALACGQEPAPLPPVPRPPPPPEGRPLAVLTVQGFGEIQIELRPDEAPRTVANFVKLAESNFYDGTTFHRVIPDFVIQGGDPNSRDRDPRNDGEGGPGWTILDEPNGLGHERGALSMANRGPNTGGSQFFLVLRDIPHLNPRHTVFGKVVAGMDVVDRIAAVETDLYGRHGPRNRPLENVVVEHVRIEHREEEDGASGDAPAPGAAGGGQAGPPG